MSSQEDKDEEVENEEDNDMAEEESLPDDSVRS